MRTENDAVDVCCDKIINKEYELRKNKYERINKNYAIRNKKYEIRTNK